MNDLKQELEQSTMVDYFFNINNLNNMCRLCLEKNQTNTEMCNIFEELRLSSMIMACASVQILNGDGLPNMICPKCLTKLNIAWQFKLQCETSDSTLRQYLATTNNGNHLQVTPDLEGFNIAGVKQEQSLFLLNQQNILNTSSAQTFTQSQNINEPQIQKVDDVDKKQRPPKKPREKQKSDKGTSTKTHQCDTCGKTFTRREYLTQHIRIHTGEKPYHCHICEKRFVNSGHLTTHMRTHTGEKPHGCNLCPKAFSTRQELQKHTMVHNGERPFVCHQCNKKFGSSSNLYSHLRHHTGEKNFTCEHCGKAFYTKQELKQHFVVHTGEKAFLCEYCNKRFSQIAHLRRHSRLHK